MNGVLPGFEWGTPKMGGDGSLGLLQRTMEAMAPGKSTERKRAGDSDGLGKTLVDIQYERSSQKGAFSPALGKRCFGLRMGPGLIAGAFPTLPAAPTTILVNQKGFKGKPTLKHYILWTHNTKPTSQDHINTHFKLLNQRRKTNEILYCPV